MDFFWKLFVELRKELVESQKIRSQIIGFKVTFVSAAIGFLATHLENVDRALFVIPSIAAICFDFIIYSYSFSIKRIGYYCRHYIEPAIKKSGEIPSDYILWQEFLTSPKTKQHLSLYGNFGLTLLTIIIAVVSLFSPFRIYLSSFLLLVLAIFTVIDILAYRAPFTSFKRRVTL